MPMNKNKEHQVLLTIIEGDPEFTELGESRYRTRVRTDTAKSATT